jgi:hypothetical protein
MANFSCLGTDKKEKRGKKKKEKGKKKGEEGERGIHPLRLPRITNKNEIDQHFSPIG